MPNDFEGDDRMKSQLKLEPKKIESPKIEKIDSEYFDPKTLKFNFDLSKANYQLDRLQEKFLQFYLRSDSRFRKAFNTNYTNDFLGFIGDKAKLNEPTHLSVLGGTRQGKSYSSISICAWQQAHYKRKFGIDYICANAQEFLEKLKMFPPEKLMNRIFLIDEQKTAIFNIGSIARKMKLQDVQNIIAINNISTIMLNPIKFANTDANYGLRLFGRDFESKTCRMMMYNLQESAKLIPVGNVYLPIFTAFLPKDYAEPLEQAYLKKKMEWVSNEREGRGDVLAEIRRKSAEHFIRDKQYLELKKKNEKLTYISQKLGSEFTKNEVEDIYNITKLLERGINLEKE
jgi:hypothetical protein